VAGLSEGLSTLPRDGSHFHFRRGCIVCWRHPREVSQEHVNRLTSLLEKPTIRSFEFPKPSSSRTTVQIRSIEPWEDPMARFDAETLRKLHDCKEVAIRTAKHPGSTVTIWVVVSSTDVFVRSVRGAKGRWYRDLATGGAATLEFNGEQVAVQAVPTTDALSIERASQEFLSKYRSSPYAASIVRPEVLETTLRLDPQ
jgi:hypothetical protein